MKVYTWLKKARMAHSSASSWSSSLPSPSEPLRAHVSLLVATRNPSITINVLCCRVRVVLMKLSPPAAQEPVKLPLAHRLVLVRRHRVSARPLAPVKDVFSLLSQVPEGAYFFTRRMYSSYPLVFFPWSICFCRCSIWRSVNVRTVSAGAAPPLAGRFRSEPLRPAVCGERFSDVESPSEAEASAATSGSDQDDDGADALVSMFFFSLTNGALTGRWKRTGTDAVGRVFGRATIT